MGKLLGHSPGPLDAHLTVQAGESIGSINQQCSLCFVIAKVLFRFHEWLLYILPFVQHIIGLILLLLARHHLLPIGLLSQGFGKLLQKYRWDVLLDFCQGL